MDEHFVSATRNKFFSSVEIEPPLSAREVTELPSAHRFGSEGSEWIPPTPYYTEGKTLLCFESSVFGLKGDEQFIDYVDSVAGALGVSSVDITLVETNLQNSLGDSRTAP